MAYDYAKLSGKIVEVFTTQAKFAEAMRISEHTISMRLNGKAPWKQDEILRAAELLGIANEDINIYFFKLKVQD